jgi:CRP/FNR family transcriptional regulator, cyclic AMP receptor protein
MSESRMNSVGQPEGIAFLQDLDESGWKTVIRYTDACSFRAGDMVVRMGDTDRSFCIVTDGQLEAVLPTENSQEYRKISLIEEGSVFGEQSFLDGHPRSAHIRAVTSGRMRVMSFRAFERLAEDEPRLAQMVLIDLGRIVSERLRQTTAFMNRLYMFASETRPPS